MTAVKKKFYTILVFCLVHFRVFQEKQRFTFGKRKRNLVIYGRNKSGKTALVDALEFGFSSDGTVKRFSVDEYDTEHDPEKVGGQVALFNYRSDVKGKKGAVQIVMDFQDGGKGDKFAIDRKIENSKEKKSNAHLKFLSKVPVLPIIRGEELLFFVSVWISTKRFEGIETWKQRSPEFKQWNYVSEVIKTTKIEIEGIVEFQSKLVAKLATITNQKVNEWSEPAILNYINDNIFSQNIPNLLMLKLEKSDSALQKVREIISSSKDKRSQVDKRNVKRESNVQFKAMLNTINKILKLKDDYEELNQAISKLTKDKEVFERELKSSSENMKRVVQQQIDELHDLMNEYYQYIQGDSNQIIHLRLVADEDTGREGFNLAVDVTTDRKGVLPGDYLTCAEKQSFALAFHLATIVKFNPEAPIIILDDILLSYDEESRNTITALIVEKFPEHQFIITSCDRPFCDILKSRVDRNKWKFVEIVGFNEEYGPIFNEFQSIEQQIKDRWAQGLSALWLIRLYLEQNFRLWAYQLNVKLPVLKDAHMSNYSLKDLMNGFQEFTTKNKIDIPRLKAIDTNTLTYLGNLLMENTGSHAQDVDTTPYSKGDEEKRWQEVQEFMAMMTCKSCNKVHGFKDVVVQIENKVSKQVKSTFVCMKCSTPLVFIKKNQR